LPDTSKPSRLLISMKIIFLAMLAEIQNGKGFQWK